MSAPFRFPRAVAVTAAMFSLAAGAHVLAGGALPGPAITVGLLALALAPVMILTQVKLAAPLMAGLLAAGQLALHQAFEALSVSGGFVPASGDHLHVTGSAAHPTAAMTSAAAMMPEPAAVPGALMLALHAAATLATALVLARAEAALWALAAWLRPLIRLLTAVVVHPWPQLPVPARIVIPSRWRNLRLPDLRGPPRAPAAP
ncbi:hypothetical protein [Pseudarthrobacter sp. S9]|uniref:hypothetical protein n=1 Tax=Pseudarthrobacter sp. S9 TaxID=3418421 RepID=UPI003D073C21